MEFNHLTKLLGNEKILSCLISKKNELVFEYYKNKKVEKNLQTLNSCTKSVMSSLIGIAIDKGHIKDIHIPIKELFANDITNSDLRLNNLTIYHLLTMTSGFDWPEFGEWNYFAPMLFSLTS